MTRLIALSTTILTLTTTAALAGNSTIPISEPGMLGIFAGGVILALALARRARK